MANNDEIIETLGLNIEVNIKNEKQLKSFEKQLKSLEESMKSFNAMVDRFNSNTVNAVFPQGKFSNTNFQNKSQGTMPALKQSSVQYTNGNIPDTSTLFTLPPLFDKIYDSALRAKSSINKFVTSVGKQSASAVKAFASKAKDLASSFSRILKYRVIRSIIKGITQGFTEGIQNLARYSNEFNKVMSGFSTSSLYFKNAVATFAQPIVEWLIPKFIELINVCVEVINHINKIVAVMRGVSSFNKAKVYNVDYAKSLDKVSSSAQKAAKSLMGFDEINKLSNNQSASSSGLDYSQMFSTERISMTDEAEKRVKAMVKSIEGILGVASFAIGGILCATGHLPLGIAFLIAGAKLTAESLDWSFAENKIANTIGIIEGIVGIASLAVGAILTFSGANVPLGIGLMAIGALGLAGSLTLMWSLVSDKVEKVCNIIAGIVAGASLAVGIVLAASGANLPLGIALIAVGAAGLVATATLNWNDMSERTKSVVSTLMAALGAALLVVGAILAFSGVNLPLGIALMAVGGVSLASAVSLNWDNLKNSLSTALDDMKQKASQKLQELKEKFENWTAKIKTPHIEWKSDGISASGALKTLLETLNLPTTLPKLSVKWYANGGFPEDGIFMANHTELVGQFSNGRTAVANNQQITDGIRQAAYEGFMQAMSSQGGSKNITFVAQLNGKTLFEEVINQNNSAMKTFGTSPLAAY